MVISGSAWTLVASIRRRALHAVGRSQRHTASQVPRVRIVHHSRRQPLVGFANGGGVRRIRDGDRSALPTSPRRTGIDC